MYTSLLDPPRGNESPTVQSNANLALVIAATLESNQQISAKIDRLFELLSHPQPHPEKETTNYHDVATTCKRYDVSRPTLYRWINKGAVKALKIGSVIRLDWNSIDKLVDKRKGGK